MRRLTPRAHLAKLAESISASLWFVPAALSLVGVALAFGVVALDRAELVPEGTTMLAAGPEGARATLSAIASSIMVVASVAFSVTILILQLTSTQYSPRVVWGFLRDRLIQVVLGVFTGTFLYVLLVLRQVVSSSADGPAFVPQLAVAGAILLALACMLLLVVFLNHVAHSIQVSAVIDRLAAETGAAIRRLYPEGLGEDAPPPVQRRPEPAGAGRTIETPKGGYVDVIDTSALEQLEDATHVRLLVRVGDYRRAGDPVAIVWPSTVRASTCETIVGAISYHRERTVRQDAAYGLRMIVDVALRALSPGVNDPTTAVYCVDALGNLLCLLVSRCLPGTDRIAPTGTTVEAPRPGFAELVRLAFRQILLNGEDPTVCRAVLEALAAIGARDPEGRHREVLGELFEITCATARRADWHEADRDLILARAAELAAGASP